MKKVFLVLSVLVGSTLGSGVANAAPGNIQTYLQYIGPSVGWNHQAWFTTGTGSIRAWQQCGASQGYMIINGPYRGINLKSNAGTCSTSQAAGYQTA